MRRPVVQRQWSRDQRWISWLKRRCWNCCAPGSSSVLPTSKLGPSPILSGSSLRRGIGVQSWGSKSSIVSWQEVEFTLASFLTNRIKEVILNSLQPCKCVPSPILGSKLQGECEWASYDLRDVLSSGDSSGVHSPPYWGKGSILNSSQ